VRAAGSHHPQGWITIHDVLRALASRVTATEAGGSPAPGRGSPGDYGPAEAREDLTALPGYQILEITITSASPAARHVLGEAAWPPGAVPVAVQDSRGLRDADPGIRVRPGDRISLLAPARPGAPEPHARPPETGACPTWPPGPRSAG
jgi:chloride channel protein, CIC family